MQPTRILPSLILAATLAACGGAADEEPMDQMGAADATASTQVAQADLSECFLRGATLEEAAERPSPLAATAIDLGSTQGQICYGAPSARGREIMGGLVPFGEPWRAGANEATAIHLDGPATIGGVPIDAGSYSLYVIPNESEWQVFLNSNVERWGIPISDEVRSTEIGSFTVTPEPTDQMVETLTYRFEPMGNGMGDLVLEWENTRIRMHMMGS